MTAIRITSFFLISLAIQSVYAVDLANRETPFHIKTIKDATGYTTCTLNAQQPAAALSGSFELPALLNDYGLFVSGTHDAQITINKFPIEMDPIQQSNGVIFMVPATLLTTGTNTIEIARRPIVSSVQTWQGTAVFSIDDFELFHPGMAFRQANPDATTSAKNSQPATANQLLWDALHYDLFIEPDMVAALTGNVDTNSRITSAALTMTAKNISANPLSQVELNFALNGDANGGLSPSGLVITAVDSGPGTAPLLEGNINDVSTINLPTPVAPGAEFKVRITYHGYPDRFYTEAFNQIAVAYSGRAQGTPSKPVVYTASQPFGGRRWFPSKDIPEDKASSTTIRIALATGLGYKAEANGLLTAVVPGPLAGQETYIWENKNPIASYLIAFYASNYVYSTDTYTGLDAVTQMPISHAIYPQNVGTEGNGAAGTKIVLETFSELYGEYPFLDQRYATATWGITFGIENQTISGMPPGPTAGVGNGLTRRNIHELAHQWWGDSVTYKNFDELWLGEGFATHAEALWEEFGPGGTRAAYHAYMNAWRTGVLGAGATPLVGQGAESILNSNVYYRRGAWVLHMLRGILGDADFFESLKQYQQIHRHSVTNSDDLRIVMETVSGKNLNNFFQQWLYRSNGASGPTFPTFGYVGNISLNAGQYSVNITTRQTQGGPTAFDIPLMYRVSDGVDSHIVTVQSNAFNQTVSVQTGTTRPLTIELDPDIWVLKNDNALSIQTVGFAPAPVNTPYSANIISGGGTGTYTSTALPPGLTLSTAGLLSGTPTTTGIYNFTVTRSGFLATTYELQVFAPPPPPSVVINEVYHDNYNLADAGEYIELYNNTANAVALENWTLRLVDGATGTAYTTLTFPAGATISPNDYYVIGNSATINAVYPGAVDLNFNLDNVIDQGIPDGMVLKDNLGQVVDSLVLRADAPFSQLNEGEAASLEGGAGRVISGPISNIHAVAGRLPNGIDTQSNLQDFAMIPPSPGSANTSGITLPFADTFNSGIRPEWRKAFLALRTATPGTLAKPALPSETGGGNFLEVFDSTGGGDVNYLPGDWNQYSVRGMIYLPPANAAPWSVGVGVGTRHESAWFGNTNGFSIEHGFYLEYQNGTTVGLKAGQFANHSGTVQFVAVNGTSSVGVGAAGTNIEVLGQTSTFISGGWNPFRLVFDRPNNMLFASIGNTALYEGVFPLGSYPQSGGFTVGFRENHTGSPAAANTEGTWVDQISIDTDITVPVSITRFELE